MSTLDARKNFGLVTANTGYGASDTSITLQSGDGAKLPQPSTDGAFNLVWWDFTTYPVSASDPNREIVRVTARTGDVLTVTRAQESTSASTKNTAGKTYYLQNGPTAKTITDIETQLDAKEIAANRGAANGYAPLGSDSLIPNAYLPALAITDTFVVANQAAMLALTAQTGDVAIRLDQSKSYILQGSSPSILANWKELLSPTDSVTSVNGQVGTVVLTSDNITQGSNNLYSQWSGVADGINYEGGNVGINVQAGDGVSRGNLDVFGVGSENASYFGDKDYYTVIGADLVGGEVGLSYGSPTSGYCNMITYQGGGIDAIGIGGVEPSNAKLFVNQSTGEVSIGGYADDGNILNATGNSLFNGVVTIQTNPLVDGLYFNEFSGEVGMYSNNGDQKIAAFNLDIDEYAYGNTRVVLQSDRGGVPSMYRWTYDMDGDQFAFVLSDQTDAVGFGGSTLIHTTAGLGFAWLGGEELNEFMTLYNGQLGIGPGSYPASAMLRIVNPKDLIPSFISSGTRDIFATNKIDARFHLDVTNSNNVSGEVIALQARISAQGENLETLIGFDSIATAEEAGGTIETTIGIRGVAQFGTTAIGVFGSAEAGGPDSWAGFFESGNVFVRNAIINESIAAPTGQTYMVTVDEAGQFSSDVIPSGGGSTAWASITGTPTTLAGYGISDTKANFDTALSDGNFLYVGDVTQYTNEMAQDTVATLIQNGTGITWSYNDGANTLTPTVTITQYTDEMAQDAIGLLVGAGLSYNDTSGVISSTITQYTDEMAQDAVGNILTDSSEIDFTYNDGANTITAVLKDGIAATRLADGSISNTEFQYLNGVTSAIQTQIDGKLAKSMAAYTFWANNTNATADATAIIYKEFQNLSYSGTTVWTGTTAPSGTLTQSYSWKQVGKQVTIEFNSYNVTNGTSLTVATFTLPTDMPAPLEPTGFGAADETLYSGSGFITTNRATDPTIAARVSLKINAGDTGYEFKVSSSSVSARFVQFTLTYTAA